MNWISLERYVSKDVVRELIDNRESVLNSLEGAHKPITVLFSDLRGFTSRTEGSDAVRLVKQLNEYFNRMVRIVFANTGTLDKFIGDGLMAHWGSIVSEGAAKDATKAVRAALGMRTALAALNDEWRARGWRGFDFGVGINSGDAIVGNLGCEEKMEVSVIGDAVNLASRIEGATKPYHLDILIGPNAAELVRGSFILRSVDLTRVSGKSQTVELFTVLGERAAGQRDPDWLVIYEEAIRLYRTREFARSVARFEEVARLRPDDCLNTEYLGRARHFDAKPPGPKWTGVHVLTEK